MPCRTVAIPGGGYAIVCRRAKQLTHRCVVCHTVYNMKLCDYPLSGVRHGETCSRPVCATHAHHTDPDYDLCPSHARVVATQEKE